jgi:hypothetical protein
MAKMQKPDPKNMVKIGELRKIVAGLKKRQAQLDYDLDGVEISDVNTKPLFIERDANEKRISKYEGILNKFDKENPSQDVISKVIRIGRAIKKEF